MSSLSRSIFRNMAAQVAGRLYTSSLSFVLVMVLLARRLSAGEFGIFNYYLTLFYIAVTLIDFGTNTIAVREASRTPERLPALLAALVRLRGGFAAVCTLVVCAAAVIQENDPAVRLLVCLAALHLLTHALGGFQAAFHARMRFGLAALANGAGHTVFFLLGLAALAAGAENPGIYLAAFGLGIAAGNGTSLLLARRLVGAPLPPPSGETGRLFREALPLGISSIMVTVYFYVDTVLLRPLKGAEAVGYYNAAYRFLVFSLMVPVLFNQVVFPVYSRCFSGNGEQEGAPERLRRIFRRAVLYMGVTGVPAAAALPFFARPLMVLVCGEKYARSATCLQVLGLAMAVIFLTYPHLSLLVASGRQVLFAWIAGLSGLFNVGLNLLLIPRFSFEGAAWATVATESLVLCSAVLCVRRFAGLTAFSREMVKIPLAAAAVVLVSFLLAGCSLAVALPVLLLAYMGLLFMLRLLPFDMHDERLETEP